MPMNQPGTQKGVRHETGEHEPKGVTSRDRTGERKERMVAGVAMGQADGVTRDGVGKHEGHMGEFNSGTKEGDCYSHKRIPHEQDK